MSKSILLVEDEYLIAIDKQKQLERCGHEVSVAHTGEEAIDHCNQELVDLVLMDINLGAGMDGVEAAEAILKNHDIPLIFLSNHTELEVVEKIEKVTSYGYIVKTSGIAVLDASIKMAFRLHEANRISQESEYKFKAVIANAPVGMTLTNFDGSFSSVNQAFCDTLGYPIEEVSRGTFMQFTHPDDIKESFDYMQKLRYGSCRIVHFEKRFIHKSGRIIWASIQSSVLEDAQGIPQNIINCVLDVTSFKQIEEEQKQAAIRCQEIAQEKTKEKETLIREIHHRTKNSMNTIQSLLSIQADILEEKSPAAKEALMDAARRVQSILILYDKLYQGSNESMTSLDLKAYLPELIRQIINNFPNTPELEVSIDDSIILSTKVLQPVGIIINELLTNIMKHAFKNKEGKGLIRVNADQIDGYVRIKVSDNGVGIPKEIDFKTTKGFGLMLIKNLAQQIGGSAAILRGEGTQVIIDFPN
jgi:PAS domain S-box-containing protein